MCADPDWLKRVEDELMAMVSLAIPAHLRAKIDIDDVRQGARLRLHQNQKALEGRSVGEQRAYLKEAVASELADVARRYQAKRRHTARERSLDAALDDSSNRLGLLLAADQTSPSGRASRAEQAIRLETALSSLQERQREAIQLHHLHGMSVEQTAKAMGLTKGAVAGLIARGMKHLRELLQD
jgi:RNA polymerase sigma-70 factor, ECF subfamily